jgi:ABC-type multidrug transport system fused ATPase/permease subunit
LERRVLGKTTIINLINRFYEIDKGEILIDGINVKDINLKSLRRNIGVVLQDPFIFAKSIKSNIALNTKIDEVKIEEAVRYSSADKFLEKQKDGIMEIAKERGEAFSNGEKQLIAFARIFAHDPSIFVLDEATANIDTQTEEAIQRSIDRICMEKTSIFIAHRLSTIRNVDKIIVMDKGTIVETGNHDELIETGGYYSNLYKFYYRQME